MTRIQENIFPIERSLVFSRDMCYGGHEIFCAQIFIKICGIIVELTI